jgi:hypothetical protein
MFCRMRITLIQAISASILSVCRRSTARGWRLMHLRDGSLASQRTRDVALTPAMPDRLPTPAHDTRSTAKAA